MSKEHNHPSNRLVPYPKLGIAPGDLPVSPGYNSFKFYFVQDRLSYLMGQVLTVIDAVISPSIEEARNKAVKDLIRDKVNEQHNFFLDLAYKHPEDSTHEGHLPRCEWEDGLIPYGKVNDDTKYSFKWGIGN
jgi:hypothetical protein